MSELRISYWWRFHIKSESDGSIRSVAAWLFRRIATVIDGKPSLSIDVASTPCVSEEERSEIIHRGIHYACEMFKEAVKREALEEGMRETMPDLYGGDQ